MFTEKKVQILDKEKLQPGNFITLAKVDHDYDEDEAIILYQGKQFNALVKQCFEFELEIITYEGKQKSIGINQLYRGDSTDGSHTKYKIIAVHSTLLPFCPPAEFIDE